MMKLVRVTRYRKDEDEALDTDGFSLNAAHIEEIGRTPDYVTYIRMTSGLRILVDEAQGEVEEQFETRPQNPKGACILTAENMHTADDCTMHDHEPN